MSFYEFNPNDIIHTHVATNPAYTVILQGNAVTGSVYLEKKYLNNDLSNRQIQGFSERLGGLTTKYATITASVDFVSTQEGIYNPSVYASMRSLYQYYSLQNYALRYNGVRPTSIRVVTVPEIYYDRCIKSGTFSASDHDASGSLRELFDDGRGNIYSGSITGSFVGNLFYSEGIAVLSSPNLLDFGAASPDNFKWRVDLRGTHTIPVNVYRCRAPAGELNASTNTSFYTVPTQGQDKNFRMVLSSSVYPYITAVGLYNQDHELVALARLAQPIKKDPMYDVEIRLKMDW